MAYTHKRLSMLPDTLAAQSLTALADVQILHAMVPAQVLRALVQVTTSVVSSAPVAVSVVKRPVHGSATGEVIIATLNIPGGTAAGKVVYKDLEQNPECLIGNEIIFRVATAAAGGGAAGAGLFDVEVCEGPEVPLNQSNMLKSL